MKTIKQIVYLTVLTFLVASGSDAFAQGTIFGTVTNSGGSTPANGQISFFGFLSDTDEEIRIDSADGANYDAGNWFDNFQNYLTEAAGNPYDYYFYNATNSEGFHLAKLQPSNSFQREDIQLASVIWPSAPTGLTGNAISSASVLLTWNGVSGLTYHIYRRNGSSNGSLFRIDNPTGQLSDRGIADSFYVDATVDGVISYDYLIIAEDDSGNYSPHTEFITVNSSSVVAPTINSIDPTSGSADGGTSVTILGSEFDQNGATATIGGVALSSVTVLSPFELTGVSQAGPAGAADVLVTNTSSGLTSSPLVGGFTYIGNQPPVLDPIGSRSGDEGQLLTFDITASDPDGPAPSLTALPLLSGASLTDNGGGSWTFDWTPTFGQSGDYFVTFTASDGALVDSEVVQITVNNVNQPPLLDPIGSQSVDEGQLLAFGITVSDPDGPIPALTTSPLPPGAAVTDNGGGSWTFDWTPTFGQAGIYSVTFTATDDSAAVDFEIVQITVNLVNQPPVLDPIGSQSVDEGQVLSFGVTASDVDGVVSSLTALPLPNGASLTDNGGGSWTFTWSTSFGDAGLYFVTFTATDDSAAVDSEVVQITVNNVNQPPILNPIGSQSVDEGQLLSFGITAFDPNGTIPTLTVIPLPSGATVTDNGGGSWTFDWAVSFSDAGVYMVTFLATDDSLAVDSEVVQITVNDINPGPILDSIGPRSTQETVLLSIAVSASDPDGTIPTLDATILPPGATFADNSDGTGIFNWIPDTNQAGIYIVTFSASDGVLVDSEPVTITVLEAGVNLPPVLDPIGPKSVEVTTNLNFTVSATDPNGTIPEMRTSALPPGASFVDNMDGTGTFDWTPTVFQTGDYQIVFQALDADLAFDFEFVIITVFSPTCCINMTGNIDNDPNDEVDIADLTFFIDHLFISFVEIPCPAEGNVDGDPAGVVDIADLTLLIDHLFISFVPTAACQ